MAILNTKLYPKHLDKRINDIFFDTYTGEESMFDKLARVHTMGKGTGGELRKAELSGLGNLREIKEGNPVGYDQPVEGNEKVLKPTKYGLGIQITPEMLQDDVQQNFRGMPEKLGISAAYKRETVFWDLFNNGFATHLAWDGHEIFEETSRTTLKSGDAQNNRPSTDAALSETPLQAAFAYYDGVKRAAGQPISGGKRFALIVPNALRWTAKSIWKDEGPLLSANRNINTLDPANMEEEWRPWVVRHLTSTTAWFLISLDMHDFEFLWWNPIRMQSADDFATDSALFKTTCRFGVGCYNPIGAYGTTGA